MLLSCNCLRRHANRCLWRIVRSLVRVLSLPAAMSLTLYSTAALAVPDPSSVDSPGIAPVYRSAFAGYRGWQDRPVQPWTASNEAAARAGGWRAYAREAARSEVAPPDSMPAPKPAAVERRPEKDSPHAH